MVPADTDEPVFRPFSGRQRPQTHRSRKDVHQKGNVSQATSLPSISNSLFFLYQAFQARTAVSLIRRLCMAWSLTWSVGALRKKPAPLLVATMSYLCGSPKKVQRMSVPPLNSHSQVTEVLHNEVGWLRRLCVEWVPTLSLVECKLLEF